MRDMLVFFADNFAGPVVDDAFAEDAAVDPFGEALFRGVFAAADGDSLARAAVFIVDDQVLRDVDETAGQVAGVGGPERGIG